MPQQISVHTDAATVLAELRHLVIYLQALGHERCDVLFGWAWGMKYYPTAQWAAGTVPLTDLEAKVRQVENAGLGRFGDDDVYITIAGLDCEFCFCHHAGIHLTFTRPSQVADDFLAPWRSGGLSPIERDTASRHEAGDAND